jgi:hypothetical protein
MRTLKVVLAVGVTMVAMVSVSVAQTSLHLGLKGGINSASLSGEGTDVLNALTTFGFGAYARVNLSPQFAFQPEIIYVLKGAKESASMMDIDAEAKVKIRYVEIPVLARIEIPTKGNVAPHLYAGPAFAFATSAKAEIKVTMAGFGISEEMDISNEKSSDFGLVFGGGVDIGLGSTALTLEGRYTLGMQNIVEDAPFTEWDIDDPPPEIAVLIDGATDEAFDVKNRVLSFWVGLTIPIGGTP